MSGNFSFPTPRPNTNEKTKLASYLITLFVSAPLCAKEPTNCAKTQKPSENAYCYAQSYKETYKLHRNLLNNTRILLIQADRYFAEKNYDEASDAYSEAWANSPNVYAKIRHGDAIVLSYLTTKEFHDDDFKSTGSCFPLPDFVRSINFTIEYEYETSLELNKLIKTKPLVTKAMLAETRRKTICLKAMTDKYRQAKTGCADMEELRACIVPAK